MEIYKIDAKTEETNTEVSFFSSFIAARDPAGIMYLSLTMIWCSEVVYVEEKT